MMPDQVSNAMQQMGYEREEEPQVSGISRMEPTVCLTLAVFGCDH